MFSRLPLQKISFRLQITLLSLIVLVLLGAVLSASFFAFHYTRSSVLKEEQRSLTAVTLKLSQEYKEKEDFAVQQHEAGPLGNPDAVSSQEILTLLTRVVLQNIPGVEGGFYSAPNDKIMGTFPPDVVGTGDGLGQKDRADEQAEVLQAARQAAATNQHIQQVFTTNRDIVLLDAMPLAVGPSYTASVWTMKSLPDLPGSNRFRAYLIFTALGAGALACVILTLLLVRNLQIGVQKIEKGLQDLEVNLASRIRTEDDPDEIKRIAFAINRLGASLQEKIESEKLIEDRLRHAERLAALGRLVAGVAHEVRNPLATIRLRVQMCEEASEDSVILESCGIALEEIERLNGMVNRLLSFSRPVHLHPEPTNLTQLVEQRLACFRERARSCEVKIITNMNGNSRLVSVDQSRMAQVFDNVIQNAIEAMSEAGGNLCVNISEAGQNRADRSIYVEFSDTGNGISTSDLGRIFDPFFTTKPTGTGLGLSICHELVRAHRGEIQIASANGHGTTVRIVVPANDEDVTPGPA